MILRNLREGKGLFQECAKVQDTPIKDVVFFHVIGILEEEEQFVVKFKGFFF